MCVGGSGLGRILWASPTVLCQAQGDPLCWRGCGDGPETAGSMAVSHTPLPE